MADDKPIVLSPATFDRHERAVEYVEGWMRATIPGGSNGQNGPAFADSRRARVITPVGEELPVVRIDSSYTGQGKYKAFLQTTSSSPGSNIGTLTNVCLGSSLGQTDGEQVIVWNAFENDRTNIITGTNRTHLLTSNQYISGIFYGIEAIEGQTNTARVVLVNWIPVLGCGL